MRDWLFNWLFDAAVSEGAHSLRNFDLTATSGLTASGASGYLLVTGLLEQNSDRRAIYLGTGAGFFIGGILLAGLAHEQLATAGDIYNRKFKTLLTPLQGGGAALVQTTF